MSLSFGLSPWLLVLCLVLAAGLTYWTYRRTTPPISRGWRWLLGGLRFVALALIFFLLFEPIVRQLSTTERPPVLAVLIDDSESLQVTSAAVADTASASPRDAVADALRRLETSDLPGEKRYFAFSSGLRALDTDQALDSLRFDGARTDLAGALEAVRDELQDANLRGVAILSDGQYNTGQNPLYVAERFPAPIYPIVLGDTTRRRDLQIRRVTTNDIAYVDAELPIQIGLRAEAGGGERVTLELLRDGERVAAERVVLPDGTAEVPIDLTYTPTEPGLQRLTARVTRLDGEVTYRNNERPITVRVLESKRRVLLLGAAPTPTVGAVRRLLTQNEDTEVAPFVPKRGGGFYQGELPDDLSAFDVMVLVGFPSAAVPAATVERVAEAAADDMPLFFVLDRQTDLPTLRQHFSSLLPVQLERIRSTYVEAALVPTEQGAQHPILEIPDMRPELWRQLPPLQYNESRWAASPDARVLATTRVRGVELNDPLLTIRERSGQRTAALLGADSWRWSNLPEDLQAVAPVWPTLLGNTIEWVTTREDDRRVRIEPIRETFAGTERVSFTGQVYDESFNPVNDATVEINVEAPDGSRYPYSMNAVGNGRYVLDVGTLPAGSYTYAAEATREGAALGTDQGQFAVGSLTLEFRATRANAALMRQLAQRSGGTAFAPANADDLPIRLTQSETFAPATLQNERDRELWHVSWFLAAIIVLLATEWALRKRRGMV
jgi:hypothetical protein